MGGSSRPSRPATSRRGSRSTNRIGEVAEAANHHPDLTLTYPTLGVLLTSHDVGGVTARDVRMARSITEHAAGLGVMPREAIAGLLPAGDGELMRAHHRVPPTTPS